MVTHRALHVWRRNFTVYRTYYKASLVGNIGDPLLYLFAMGYGIGTYLKMMEGMPYIDFIAPGLIVTSAMYSAVFECTFGSFTRMTTQRTFDSILATPVSIEDLVFGEILWGMTKSVISATVMILIMILFGLYTPSFGFIGIVFTVAATGILFASAALCFSAIAPSYDFFSYFFTLFIAPMFFLSGVFFPLDRFPEIVQWLSQALPATHSVLLMRYFFHGASPEGFMVAAIFIVLMDIVLALWAVRLVRKRLII